MAPTTPFFFRYPTPGGGFPLSLRSHSFVDTPPLPLSGWGPLSRAPLPWQPAPPPPVIYHSSCLPSLSANPRARREERRASPPISERRVHSPLPVPPRPSPGSGRRSEPPLQASRRIQPCSPPPRPGPLSTARQPAPPRPTATDCSDRRAPPSWKGSPRYGGREGSVPAVGGHRAPWRPS